MHHWLIGFLSGATSANWWPSLPENIWLVLLSIAAVSFLFISKSRPVPGYFLSGVATGVVWLSIFGHLYLQVSHGHGAKVTEDTITAQLIELPVATEFGWKTQWSVLDSLSNPSLTGQNILLNWYQQPPAQLQIGQRWRLMVRLKPPHSTLNQGGFDYQRYLLSKNLNAKGYVKRPETAALVKPNHSYRSQIAYALRDMCGELSSCDLLLALAVADRGSISAERWQLFRDTGTSHLLAISGLHIGLVFGTVLLLGKGLQRWLAPSPKTGSVAVAAALFLALVYAALAGYAVPTQRAVAALLLLWWLRRHRLSWKPGEVLILIAAATAMLQPHVLFGLSYWLSFGAVAALVLLHWWGRRIIWSKQPWLNWLIWFFVVQIWLALTLAPLTVVNWGGVSLVSPMANLLMLPLIGFAVLPVLLLALLAYFIYLPLFSPLLHAADSMLSIGLSLLKGLAAFQPAYVTFPPGDLPALFAAFALFALGVSLIRQRRFRTISKNFSSGIKWLLLPLGVAFLMPIYAYSTRSDANWQLTVLDVGQGLSVLVQQGEKVAIYDTGNAFGSGFSYAERVIEPYLKYHGIEQIEFLFISHDDADHAGGMSALNRLMPVRQLIVNFSEPEMRQSGLCTRGRSYQMGSLQFEILHPVSPVYTHNNDSCVVKVTDGNWTVLLPGDIEKDTEAALLEHYPNLGTDVLIAPHHGSRSSSSRSFILATAPAYAVFSAGYLNSYHQPAAEIVQRYREANVITVSTSAAGQVNFKFSNDAMVMEQYRFDISRRWFYPTIGWNQGLAPLE